MDNKDRAILRELQLDGRLSNQDLAKRVGLSPTPCWRRVKRLEESGLIARYVALLDVSKLDLPVVAYAQVSLEDHHPKTVRALDKLLAERDEVMECMALSGDYDYLMKVRTRTLEDYWEFVRRGLLNNPGVRSVNTSFVMNTRKLTTALPV